jgi:hypothetical protein
MTLAARGGGGEWRLEGTWSDAEVANRFLAHLATRGFSAATIRAYAYDLVNVGCFALEFLPEVHRHRPDHRQPKRHRHSLRERGQQPALQLLVDGRVAVVCPGGGDQMRAGGGSQTTWPRLGRSWPGGMNAARASSGVTTCMPAALSMATSPSVQRSWSSRSANSSSLRPARSGSMSSGHSLLMAGQHSARARRRRGTLAPRCSDPARAKQKPPGAIRPSPRHRAPRGRPGRRWRGAARTRRAGRVAHRARSFTPACTPLRAVSRRHISLSLS